MELTPWKRCLQQLEGELTAQQFNTWIRPLHVIENKNAVHLLAPNRFVQNWISERYLSRIEELLSNKTPEQERVLVKLDVGSHSANIEQQNNHPPDDRPFEKDKKKKVNEGCLFTLTRIRNIYYFYARPDSIYRFNTPNFGYLSFIKPKEKYKRR